MRQQQQKKQCIDNMPLGQPTPTTPSQDPEAAHRLSQALSPLLFVVSLGTIHLRRRHVLGGMGVLMGRWSKGHST